MPPHAIKSSYIARQSGYVGFIPEDLLTEALLLRLSLSEGQTTQRVIERHDCTEMLVLNIPGYDLALNSDDCLNINQTSIKTD